MPYVVRGGGVDLFALFSGAAAPAQTTAPGIDVLFRGTHIDQGRFYMLQLNPDHTYSYYYESMSGGSSIMVHEGTYVLEGDTIVLTKDNGAVVRIGTDSLRSFSYGGCEMKR